MSGVEVFFRLIYLYHQKREIIFIFTVCRKLIIENAARIIDIRKLVCIIWFLILIYFWFFCSCSSRYVGEFCEYPNPCHTGPGPRCQNGGSCTVSFREGTPVFTCSCPIGFSASLCEIPEKNACDSKPCLHGGMCTLKSLEQYTCSCAQGYTGKFIHYFQLFQKRHIVHMK